MTTAVEKTIEVQAPIRAVYDQWTQFEEFPTFMGGISEVRQLDDSRLHWVAEIAGVRREWDARIVEQVPDAKIAWVATEGATNAGAVFFTELTPMTTLVRLSLEYAPEGMVEKAGDALGLVEKRATADLQKFKELIEARGVPSGGWRGEVADAPQLGAPGAEQAAQTRGDSGKAGLSTKAAVAGAAAAVVGVAAAAALKGKRDESHEQPERLPEAKPVPSLPPVEPVRSIKADAHPAPTITPASPAPRPTPKPAPVPPPVDRTRESSGEEDEVVVRTEIVIEPRH